MLQATFRQLQTFVEVAQAGSFSAAANTLLISQQAISNQIRALEKSLGQTLFERRAGAAPVLSEKGLALLERAPVLLAQAQDVVSLVGAGRAAPLRARLATGEYIRSLVLAAELPAFQLDHPELQLEITEFADGASLMAAVLSGRADLGYYTFESEELTPLAEVIATVEIGLYAAPTHPLAAERPLQPRAGLPIILSLSSNGAPTLSERALARAGFRNTVVAMRAQSAQTRLQLTAKGVGACVFFRDLAADDVRRGRLIDLGVQLPPWYRCAVRRWGALQMDHLRAIDSFVVDRIRQPGPPLAA